MPHGWKITAGGQMARMLTPSFIMRCIHRLVGIGPGIGSGRRSSPNAYSFTLLDHLNSATPFSVPEGLHDLVDD